MTADGRTRLRWGLAVGALMLAGLGLRLWGIKQGLPYAYNIDENAHFVPRAIGFFGHTLNPFYFVNPPGYTNLVYVVLGAWFGGGDAAARAYAVDPTQVFVVARVLSAALGTLAIGLTYLAGARLVGRRAGLLAAALIAVAFLPVFYAHLALNDSPTLAPAALCLYGIALVLTRGRWFDFALAGAAAGVAIAVKYTAAIYILPICVAAYFVWRDTGGELPHPLRLSARRAWRWTTGFLRARAFGLLVLAGAATIAGFVFATPYAILDPQTFGGGILHQAAASNSEGKLGQTWTNGWLYYLWSMTWGLGWAPAVATLAGAFALARARNRAFWVLVPTALLYVLFMGSAQRWFGRWLMPLFPVLCVLAAAGAVWAAAGAARWWAGRVSAHADSATLVPSGRLRWGLLAVAGLLLCGQGLVYSLHSDTVLARADTRAQVREWMARHLPPATKVAYEPVTPDTYFRQPGYEPPAGNGGNRWNEFLYADTPESPVTVAGDLGPGIARRVLGARLPAGAAPGAGQLLARLGVSLIPSQLPDSVIPNRRRQDPGVVGGEGYTRDLSPALLDVYRREGACYVVSGSIQAQRALADPTRVPDAVAYYRALREEAVAVYRASPYDEGAGPVPFNFDWSFDYYPMAYHRPGPEMTVWRLRDCGRGAQ
jgi:hypothetical protein